MYKKVIIFFAFLSVVNMAMGQTQTLNELIQRSITVSKSLKTSDLNLQLMKNNVENVKNAELPDIAVSEQFMFLPFAPKINYKLQSKSTSSTGTPSSTAAAPNPKFVNLAQLNITYPVFTGFRYKNALEQAKIGVQIGELSAEMQKEAVVLQTLQLYYNLYKSNEAIKVLKGNLLRSENRIKDFENFVNNGIMANNDLLKAKLQKSSVELSLEEAQTTYENFQYRLNTLLQQENTQGINFENSELIDTSIVNASISRKDLEILSKKAASSKVGIDLAKGEKYPSLALVGGYMGATIDKVLTVSNAVNLGVGIKYNVSSLYKNKTAVKSAELQYQLAQQQITETEDKAKIELNEATKNYQLSLKKQKLYEEALLQANENLRIVANKNKNGLADTDQLLEADVQQLQAEINGKIAKIEVLQAWYQRLYVAGNLLEYLKIK